MDVDKHFCHIAYSVVVVSVLVGRVDLVMWHAGRVARFGHQVSAGAHEVVLQLIKSGVVGITRGNTGGGGCGWRRFQ